MRYEIKKNPVNNPSSPEYRRIPSLTTAYLRRGKVCKDTQVLMVFLQEPVRGVCEIYDIGWSVTEKNHINVLIRVPFPFCIKAEKDHQAKRPVRKERGNPLRNSSLSARLEESFFYMGPSSIDHHPADCGKYAVQPINGASYPH